MKEFFNYLDKLNALEDAPFDLDSQWESKPKNEGKRIVKKSAKLNENYGHDGYMYITKHGLGPGTLPKDAHLLKWKDLPNYMTAIWLDRFLTTDELKQYDIYPETQIKRVMDMYDITEDDIMGESVKTKRKAGSKALKEELSDIKQEWEDFLSDGGNNVIEFDDGDYVFFGVDFDKGTIYAGSATNTGIIREYEIKLDSDLNLDENIAELYDEICREKEQEDVQSELDAEHLGESIKPKRKSTLKENKRLVEGPGAGYIIHGTIKYIDMDNIQVVKQDEDVGAIGKYYNVTGDIKGSLEDVSAEDYYHYINLYEEYGYDEIPITITNVVLSCFDDIDTVPDADEIRNIFEGLRFDVVIGGGWSHSTFDGTITLNAMNAGHYYSDFDVASAVIHVVDEDVIDIIDNMHLINDYEYEDEEDDDFEEALKIESATKDVNTMSRVQDWYVKEYPTDELGEYLDPSVTFGDVWYAIRKNQDLYKVLGAGDSVIRERVFKKLADIFDTDYNVIYDAWLGENFKKSSIKEAMEDNGLTKTTLKAIKKGTYFTFKPVEDPSENIVYVKDEYDRESRKYGYYKWSDVNNWHEKKGDTVVYTGFTF